MNKALERIIDEIQQKFECVEVDFNDESWRKKIPSEPGCYLIKTNTPIKVLRSVGAPESKSHINIPDTIKKTSKLPRGIVIRPKNNDYVVYNGENKNLKARSREHECGHKETGCLGLTNYKNLRKYRWTFCYVAESQCEIFSNGGKLLRLVVEQGWRAKNGWPILCKK